MSEAATPGADQANAAVVIDNVKYDVIAGPDDATPLVQLARTAVSQTLQIDKLVHHLSRSDDLLYVAACGVAGLTHPTTQQALGAQVMGLQYKLRMNTGEIASAMLVLGESARNMLSILRGALKDLYSLHEADAITRLARCEAVATRMAESAGKLEGNFQRLVEEAVAVLRLTSETCNVNEQEGIHAQQRQLDIKAMDESIKAKQAELELQMRKVQTLHEEAKAAQATADEGLFTQMTLGHIGTAFGGWIPASSALRVVSLEVGSELVAALGEARARYGAGEEETAMSTAESRLLNEEARKEKDAETASPATVATAESLRGGLASVSGSAEGTASAWAASAAIHAGEKSKYLDMLMDLQELKREAMHAMVQNAGELGSVEDKEEAKGAAVASLNHAAATLRQIVAILAEHKRIWTQMAMDSARFAQGDLRTNIEGWMQKSRVKRIEAYTERGFQVHMLAVAAQWHVLHVIANEYRSAIQTAYVKMGETYRKNPTIDEARRLAPILGTALAEEVAAEIRVLGERIGQMGIEQQEQATGIEQATAERPPGTSGA
jgi:hypothetical protein